MRSRSLNKGQRSHSDSPNPYIEKNKNILIFKWKSFLFTLFYSLNKTEKCEYRGRGEITRTERRGPVWSHGLTEVTSGRAGRGGRGQVSKGRVHLLGARAESSNTPRGHQSPGSHLSLEANSRKESAVQLNLFYNLWRRHNVTKV